MMSLYHQVCQECSKLITNRYSTSFSLGIKLFSKPLREPIYAIYGFVRFADEIVDTFHSFDKKALLQEFSSDTFRAIEQGISLNPVLNSFQQVVREYDIEKAHIQAFLDSMAMDLEDHTYDRHLYEKYIYGSAEVVGLMCLKIFLKDNPMEFTRLNGYACSLGSAFQKINFLRDIKEDYHDKGRVYFPGLDMKTLSPEDKKEIEEDIELDFNKGLKGIQQLPKSARFGVYIAYIFYFSLFKKIKNANFQTVLSQRIRIKNRRKAYLLAKYFLKNSLNQL